MRKPTFAYINAKTKSQIRCAVHVHVNAQLISAYIVDTEIKQLCRTPKTGFPQRGSYTIIMISIHFKRAYQLAASVWGWESLVGLRQCID